MVPDHAASRIAATRPRLAPETSRRRAVLVHGWGVDDRKVSRRGRGVGACQEQGSLAGVLREGRCALEFGLRFDVTAEFEEEVAADAREQVIRLEGGFGGEGVDEFEAGSGAEGHRYGDGAIE